ncbi:DNA/RNA non-specific endonuclease [uncultured Roseobacter sp.]|uniref:DNA/RNA non-specific endonuclease n=1 Tax=uncultured Roseobacter sp. TaxID=114847 RepID=UPI002614FCDA|nr:DNA/RNA non-specific endonuclease [uncultured Roseobacter sp.]
MVDNTKVHPSSQHFAHLIDLFLFKGAPVNEDEDHEVSILINHGYVAGYCPTRFQPLWSAYRVARASRDVGYDRPHLYYADERIEKGIRLSSKTFGRKDGIQYHVGHMVPNEAINRQFGRLAQLETFFMTNMSPQRGSLNTGVWLDLENKIRNIDDTSQKDHIWAIAGPVFGEDPEVIARDGVEVPIPDAYYYISVDPFAYPWDAEGNVDIACFLFPQDAPRGTPLDRFLVDILDIEEATMLRFFPGWDYSVDLSAAMADGAVAQVRHRLLQQL